MLVFSVSNRRFSNSSRLRTMISLVCSSRSVRWRTSSTRAVSRRRAWSRAACASCSAASSSVTRCCVYARVCLSTVSSVRYRTRLLRSAMKDSSPARTSIAFRKKVTLSKFSPAAPMRRISKNCCDAKSTSATTTRLTGAVIPVSSPSTVPESVSSPPAAPPACADPVPPAAPPAAPPASANPVTRAAIV